jgi:hypothetical protein
LASQAVSNFKFGICSQQQKFGICSQQQKFGITIGSKNLAFAQQQKFGITGSGVCSTTRFGITGSNQIGIKDMN